MIDKILHYNIIMTNSKKGGGMKETFTGIIDTMERFVNDKVLNKNNNHNNHSNHNKIKSENAIKEPINTEDSLNDHHNHYKSLESM
jgi:hypothetical protein